MDIIGAEGEQCVHCREVVHSSSECPLSEVRLVLYDFLDHAPRTIIARTALTSVL